MVKNQGDRDRTQDFNIKQKQVSSDTDMLQGLHMEGFNRAIGPYPQPSVPSLPTKGPASKQVPWALLDQDTQNVIYLDVEGEENAQKECLIPSSINGVVTFSLLICQGCQEN